MSGAYWIVAVEREGTGIVDDLDAMYVGPMTEGAAERLARNVNEGLDGFSATVEGLTPSRGARAEIKAWAGEGG